MRDTIAIPSESTEERRVLAWNSEERLWIIPREPSGRIELVNGHAHPWSKAKPGATTEGRSAAEVLGLISTLKQEAAR